jgi:membrane protein YqaA with SNARE-associated domain
LGLLLTCFFSIYLLKTSKQEDFIKMNEIEAYFLLFTDSLFGNILLYPHKEFVLFTMKALHSYNNLAAFIISLLGFLVSVIINYFCGNVLQKIYKSSVDSSKYQNHGQLVIYFQRYGYIILLLNILPLFGAFIPLLAGFVSFGITRSVLFCLISKSIFYAYYLFL